MNNSFSDIFDNGIVRIALIGVLGILTLFLLAQTITTAENFGRPGVPATDTVTVQGSGQATLPPDVARVSFTVENTAAAVADAQAACADLDGCCVDPEPFSRAVTRVVGSYSEDLKLNAAAFVAVRAEYAELVDTAAGGMRLQCPATLFVGRHHRQRRHARFWSSRGCSVSIAFILL